MRSIGFRLPASDVVAIDVPPKLGWPSRPWNFTFNVRLYFFLFSFLSYRCHLIY